MFYVNWYEQPDYWVEKARKEGRRIREKEGANIMQRIGGNNATHYCGQGWMFDSSESAARCFAEVLAHIITVKLAEY